MSPTILADNKEHEDPIKTFFSKLTNIKIMKKTTSKNSPIFLLCAKHPSHIILIIHGRKESAKSTFQRLLQDKVDPTKPALLTLHNKFKDFVMQLSQNYLIAYDNFKYHTKMATR